ncbi:AMP_1a_G0031300.mRNA.1.CDS.1 [Saccharomyces cerevisiae]|nr:AMP_1a_G0031300.mRNA.1.CDS.1 [Saccharomyces cerevisiae]CAI6756265.1 AMP_1a_G0031300.mRNA.1.CDS.1 [Saccharomyces cerevisiae]
MLHGLYPVPFTHNSHDYPHFNIYISFGGPKYCINALNTYVIPLLHRILTTQFIYPYVNITEKSPLKSPKHKIFYSSIITNKHIDLKYEHYHGIICLNSCHFRIFRTYTDLTLE